MTEPADFDAAMDVLIGQGLLIDHTRTAATDTPATADQASSPNHFPGGKSS